MKRPADVLASLDAVLLKEKSDLLHFGDDNKHFSDTAALISKLDLVVSIETGVAHLVGALAMPVWVMVLSTPDWRWLAYRDDSPWYPTAGLSRQDVIGILNNVVARVHVALREFVQGRL